MAWDLIRFEVSMGPMSSRGIMSGHGTLVEAKAMLKIADNPMGVSHRIVFH